MDRGENIPLYTTLDVPKKMNRNVVHEEHTSLGTTMVVEKKAVVKVAKKPQYTT